MKQHFLAAALALGLATAPTALSAEEITLYSGRGEALVGALIKQFETESGIKVNTRFGGSAELAALLQEEGARSPADVFWGQEGGSLSVLAPRFAPLPPAVNAAVAAPFRNDANSWVATSARTRTLAYSKERVKAADLPASVKDLANPKYKGRVAWAPTNGSFQAFVTAFRALEGDAAAKAWLVAMKDNGTKAYRNNGTQIEAIANGEVDFGLVNNYYLGRYTARDANYPVSQTHFAAGDLGNLALVAGVGIPASADNKAGAEKFIAFLISKPAQTFITDKGNEYPVIPGVPPKAGLEPYETLVKITPKVDISALADLEGTLKLLREVGLI
ncbi:MULTISPECIES: iron ABC transporter substrate-binding protein [unclassified Xanthobacter]|uniref:iron ABC transporter substrate-binding protein n=1 Tax=unclassified Xanthobacter TaxID=2623496 RepID=UPI001EDCB422|nr:MULTISPECIES: iron ABC transporter substrate-binding protein [unclassified Xanthobacter]